jgi:hypothetical protein
VFEEINYHLGLTFSYEWATSDRFGFVRTCRLINLKPSLQTVEVLDGLQNLLPCGITRRFQLEYSTLVDGYKRTELNSECGLAIIQLTSVPVDRPEPSESLFCNVAWSTGFEHPVHLLSSVQLDDFRNGGELTEETDIHGRRGAYFVNNSFELPAYGEREWKVVADVNKDTAGVRSLLHTLKHDLHLSRSVCDDVATTSQNLVRMVASADGLQQTRDQASTWHHFASTLFNIMRGGIPDDHYVIKRDDFAEFLNEINREVAKEHSAFVASLPVRLQHDRLLQLVHETSDLDFERIAHEYLPLTFSRRHGDPSRPWNIFDIRVKDERGRKTLNYQGNWRDIFQNWEALSHTYPGFTVSMIYKFLNASTADGYNPYRISRDGYDWEVLDPHDPWSYIGYWGDHQVIYLLRLLEQAQNYDPNALAQLLTRETFIYANVPYRIRPYQDLLRDPQNTIVFDSAAHKRILKSAAKLGADGKALVGVDGQLVHANLAEKLLTLLLAKLSNFVPGAGIWMNTQRPEWNDANNALVGAGTSMVTLYHLRRFLVFVRTLFDGSGVTQVSISADLATMLESIYGVLQRNVPSAESVISDLQCKKILDGLGEAGSVYREGLYSRGVSKARTRVPVSELIAFCDIALLHVDHSIGVNRRADGLYHAYNLMKVEGDEVHISNLSLMLEGQVAVLSSGALDANEAVSLLDALRKSSLYRADQNSYILYPNKTLPSFLAKNNIPSEAISHSKLLTEMIALDDRRIVVRDADGGAHFSADLRNGSLLREALEAIGEHSLVKLAKKEADQICELYEEVFQHRYFTGRSGTFYKYEGIGCIYWHMVSKLLLAALEALSDAVRNGADEDTLSRLRAHYSDIRSGLGTHKSPEVYGAVPTDPYSHTPGFAGAQQPGMTGQVKEDIIARLGEMGITVSSGKIRFVDQLITADEFLDVPSIFNYWDVNGKSQSLELGADTLAFTFCQIPVVAHRSAERKILVTRADGTKDSLAGLSLNTSVSREIFKRTGSIQRVDVFFALQQCSGSKGRKEFAL